MNAVPHDASQKTEREPPAAWVREPESPDFEPDRQPAGPDESPPADEPGYGHGV